MPAWPASLPQSMNADDYGETAADGVLRTSMDAGPDFTRPRYSAVPVPFAGSLVLSKDQVATLDEFHKTTLNGGATPFDWTHPRTGVAVSIRFLAPPAYRAFSDTLWSAGLSFEILP